MVIMAHCSRKY